MSDRICRNLSNTSIAWLGIATLSSLLVMSPLWARDGDESPTVPYVDPLVDPLHTQPEVLHAGAALPGDSGSWQCASSQDIPTPLALNDAVDLALCNNPQIKMAWAMIKMQAAAVGAADAAYLPTVSANVSHLRTATSYPDSGIPSSSVTGNTVYGSFNWRLFDFGTRAANRQSANSALAAALADHEASLQKTLEQTVQAYFDVQSSRAMLQAREQGEAIANETLVSAKRREAKGVVARSDTLEANTAFAKAVLEKNRAMGDYQKSLSVLVYALGLSAGTRIALAEEADGGEREGGSVKLAAAQADDLDRWLHNAELSHPAIRSARAQWEAATSLLREPADCRLSTLPRIITRTGTLDRVCNRLTRISTASGFR